MSDFVQQTCETIKKAAEAGAPLLIQGGGSKAFYGRQSGGEPLDASAHSGIVEYQPTELVFTARAGTPLTELEGTLADHGQMLPFEPPHFGARATIGGAVASGLSGPRRPHSGAARDLMLGCGIINGFGEQLTFGGQVMKNVAGYDISRLMVGALGTLGVITEVSMKVLPIAVAELTLAFDCDQRRALELMTDWASRPLPVSATCHDGERLHVRLSGTEHGVRSASQRLGGEPLEDDGFWQRLREHQHPFFTGARDLWRLSVKPASEPLNLPGDMLLEWSGAQRWLKSRAPAEDIRAAAAAAGGHAIHFRGHDGDDVFHPLDPARMVLHRNLKHAFDPAGILNKGRMYRDI